MISFQNIPKEEPFNRYKHFYDKAIKNSQNNIEAMAVSSISKDDNEVDSRFVNLKFVLEDKFIFFSNYDSPKSKQFISHNQVALLFHWSKINVQIRIKGRIKTTSKEFNSEYFSNRSREKNALAISSKKSAFIDSYDEVKKKYKQVYKEENLTKCPDWWGGFSTQPYYFEFWEGHESRINKRESFLKEDGDWIRKILQP